MAPAQGLSKKTREAMFADSLRLTGAAKYLCAGTVEFLVDKKGRHFFIEVNPRVQVRASSRPSPSFPPCLLSLFFHSISLLCLLFFGNPSYVGGAHGHGGGHGH